MAHINFGAQVFSIIIGTCVIFLTWHHYKNYRLPFLTSLRSFYIFLNLFFLVDALSNYLITNFFQDLMKFKTSSVGEITNPISFVFLIGFVYALLSLTQQVKEKPIPKLIKITCLVAVVMMITHVIVEFTDVQEGPFIKSLGIIHFIILNSTFLAVYCILAYFLWSTRKIEEREIQFAWKVFCLFYLCGFILLIISSMFIGEYQPVVFTTVTLLFNGFPFLWYHRHLASFSSLMLPMINGIDIDSACEKFKVSPRQKEIVELMMQGLSNRKIAEKLFIAQHTVKNHIYALYQKLGVKSRYELVHFFLEYVKR